MDASAYLKRQGWRGEGHSLDHTNRGIRKPLLISKKTDTLGLGLDKKAAVSDQWWLRAFDQSLKDFGTGKSLLLATVQKHGVRRGGLYAHFVKGEGLTGTIGNLPTKTGNEVVGASISNLYQPNSDYEATNGKVQLKSSSDDVASTKPASETSISQSGTSAGEPIEPAKMSGVKRKREGKESAGEKRDRRTLERTGKAKRKVRESYLSTELAPEISLKSTPDPEAVTNKTSSKRTTESFVNGDDEVRLDDSVTSRSGSKKIPGIGAVERYRSKAEKRGKKLRMQELEDREELWARFQNATERDKIDLYRAKQQNLHLDDYRAKLVSGEISVAAVNPDRLSSEKRASYEKRAAEKNMSLEDYMRRRDDKYASNKGKKIVKAMSLPMPANIHSSGAALIELSEEQSSSVSD